MKIELKNITHFAYLSQETNACHADVWVDSVKVGHVENRGHGEGMYPVMSDRQLLARMEQWAASQPAVQSLYGELSMNLDFYLSTLIDQDLIT